MICLSGLELYSRWVPLTRTSLKNYADLGGSYPPRPSLG